ncbi:diaminopimelate epimerase [bacterium]|nr:diaminopimelate epimerase [bacterium]
MVVGIAFSKLNGTGNDFVIVDNREMVVPARQMADFTRAVCRRAVSVGADGVIFVENHPDLDFAWHYLNADGGEAEMCGNGARCVARFAHERGIAGKSMRFQTIAGVIEAHITGPRSVKVRLTEPFDYRSVAVPTTSGELSGHFLNTGVPHVVVPVEDVESFDVKNLGREIRRSPVVAPAGANANFVQVTGPNDLRIRTYERGVEDETLACGTGCVAAAATMVHAGQVAGPVTLTVQSGEKLTVTVSEEDPRTSEVWLEGPTHWVYDGELTSEVLF